MIFFCSFGNIEYIIIIIFFKGRVYRGRNLLLTSQTITKCLLKWREIYANFYYIEFFIELFHAIIIKYYLKLSHQFFALLSDQSLEFLTALIKNLNNFLLEMIFHNSKIFFIFFIITGVH